MDGCRGEEARWEGKREMAVGEVRVGEEGMRGCGGFGGIYNISGREVVRFVADAVGTIESPLGW